MRQIPACGICMFVHDHEDELMKRDILTIDEVIERDVYKLRKFKADGLDPFIIVDIGAHIGTFTCLAASLWPNASILSFEANKIYFDALAVNAPKNANPINAAVLGYHGRESESTHTLYRGHGDEEPWGRLFCLSAHDIMRLRPSIDLLKIDCEGSEVEILREMDEIGALNHIGVIVGEWHRDIAKAEVLRLLSPTHNVELVDMGECNQFQGIPRQSHMSRHDQPAWPKMKLSEMADRYCIQQLHVEKNGQPDLDELKLLWPFVARVDKGLLAKLLNVNAAIWDLEAGIRAGEKLPDEDVAWRARSIRNLNRERVSLKNQIGDSRGESPTIKVDHASA